MRLIDTLRSGETQVPPHHEVLPAEVVIRGSCGDTAANHSIGRS
jgi:hypothetical protein